MPRPDDSDWRSVDRLERHVVSLAWPERAVKVFQIQFAAKGFFIHFPYHPDVPGLVSRCDVESGEEARVDLVKGAAVTSHKVKYSHHFDGNCHFSQDGKIRTSIRNSSAALDRDIAHVFTIDVVGLEEFSDFELERDYYRGKYGRCLFEVKEKLPGNAHFTGWWVKLGSSRIEELRNPVSFEVDGKIQRGLALGAPAESPLADYVMVVHLTFTKLDRDSEGLDLLFTGGFGPELGDPSLPSSFLALRYPARTQKSLESIDLGVHSNRASEQETGVDHSSRSRIE